MAQIRGGDRLEAALANISRGLASGGTLRVGFLENATYPDGTPVAAVAAWNDFGTRTIPPRPFFRNMVAKKNKEWPAAIAGLLRTTHYDIQRTLGITGAAIQGQLKQSIIDTNSPKLAPATIRRKEHAKPLIDTSMLINSVDFEVVRR